MSTQAPSSPAAIARAEADAENKDVAEEALKHPVPSAEVKRQIAFLVARLLAALEAPTNVCRKLCQLALNHSMSPEVFRRRLVQAGLPFSRASELKTVLAAKGECAEFLRPVKPQSWRTTLDQARESLRRTDLGRIADSEAEVTLVAAKIAGRMHRHRVFTERVDGGTLTLVAKDAALGLDLLVPT